jgi:hypothetical protein
LTSLNLSNIELSEIQHKKFEQALLPILEKSLIRELKLNNTKSAITHNLFKAIENASSLEVLELNHTNVYPGYEDQIGSLIKKRTTNNISLAKLTLSGVDMEALSNSVADPVTKPRVEESKI